MELEEKINNNEAAFLSYQNIINAIVCIDITKVIQKSEIRKLVHQISYLLENMQKLAPLLDMDDILPYDISTTDYTGIINSLAKRMEEEDNVKDHLESLKQDIFSVYSTNTSPRMSVAAVDGFLRMPIRSACLLYDILRAYDIFYNECIRGIKYFHLHAPSKRILEDLLSATAEAIGFEIFLMYRNHHKF